jgi:hypothetical protein
MLNNSTNPILAERRIELRQFELVAIPFLKQKAPSMESRSLEGLVVEANRNL